MYISERTEKKEIHLKMRVVHGMLEITSRNVRECHKLYDRGMSVKCIPSDDVVNCILGA